MANAQQYINTSQIKYYDTNGNSRNLSDLLEEIQDTIDFNTDLTIEIEAIDDNSSYLVINNNRYKFITDIPEDNSIPLSIRQFNNKAIEIIYNSDTYVVLPSTMGIDFTAIDDNSFKLSKDNTEYTVQTNITDMIGATDIQNGQHGLVPFPKIANRKQFLRGDGTWATPETDHTYIVDNSTYTTGYMFYNQDGTVSIKPVESSSNIDLDIQPQDDKLSITIDNSTYSVLTPDSITINNSDTNIVTIDYNSDTFRVLSESSIDIGSSDTSTLDISFKSSQYTVLKDSAINIDSDSDTNLIAIEYKGNEYKALKDSAFGIDDNSNDYCISISYKSNEYTALSDTALSIDNSDTNIVELKYKGNSYNVLASSTMNITNTGTDTDIVNISYKDNNYTVLSDSAINIINTDTDIIEVSYKGNSFNVLSSDALSIVNTDTNIVGISYKGTNYKSLSDSSITLSNSLNRVNNIILNYKGTDYELLSNSSLTVDNSDTDIIKLTLNDTTYNLTPKSTNYIQTVYLTSEVIRNINLTYTPIAKSSELVKIIINNLVYYEDYDFYVNRANKTIQWITAFANQVVGLNTDIADIVLIDYKTFDSINQE